MIKAQATVLNKGTFSNGTWTNVTIKILYPNTLSDGTIQNSSSNSININDVIVDNNGFVWQVLLVTASGSNYTCSLKELSELNPIITMEPDTILEKGLVVTPNSKNLLVPYYHDSYVSTNSFKAAMSYNMKKIGSTNPTGVVSEIMFFEFKNNLNSSPSGMTLEKSRDNISYNSEGAYIYNNNGFNLNNYNTLLSDPNVYTIEFRIKFDQGHYTQYNIPPIYIKLIDFNFYVYDAGFYMRNGRLCFYAYDCGNDINKTLLEPNVFYIIKFIKNSQQLLAYIDGVKQFDLLDNNNNTAPKSKLGFFTDDNQIVGEPFFGTVNYIKIYDGIKI